MLRKNFWKERQELYLKVFEDALPLMQERSKKQADGYENEDAISRDMFFSVENTIFSSKYIKLELGVPIFQVYAQPDEIDDKKAKREDKCPDFLWTFVDYVNKQRRDFYVECKRLRVEQAKHSREYVVNGVKRFLEKEWSYGNNCDLGLMIGYVEGLPIDTCVIKIDEYLTQNKIPTMETINSVSGVMKTKHSLDRSEIPQTPFVLFHYFIVINNAKNI